MAQPELREYLSTHTQSQSSRVVHKLGWMNAVTAVVVRYILYFQKPFVRQIYRTAINILRNPRPCWMVMLQPGKPTTELVHSTRRWLLLLFWSKRWILNAFFGGRVGEGVSPEKVKKGILYSTTVINNGKPKNHLHFTQRKGICHINLSSLLSVNS